MIIPVALGAALIAAFAVHALRTRIEPLIDLRLFRSRSFTAAAGLMFLGGLSIFGAMLLLPLYYQQARGQSALDAGVLLAPQGLGMMLVLPIVGKLVDTVSPRPLVLIGMALATLGTIPFALVGQGTSELALSAALVIRGAGLGAVFVPAMTVAYRGLRTEAIPRATSAVRIFQQIGASFGTAVLAVILVHQTNAHAAGGARGAGRRVRAYLLVDGRLCRPRRLPRPAPADHQPARDASGLRSGPATPPCGRRVTRVPAL